MKIWTWENVCLKLRKLHSIIKKKQDNSHKRKWIRWLSYWFNPVYNKRKDIGIKLGKPQAKCRVCTIRWTFNWKVGKKTTINTTHAAVTCTTVILLSY